MKCMRTQGFTDYLGFLQLSVICKDMRLADQGSNGSKGKPELEMGEKK